MNVYEQSILTYLSLYKGHNQINKLDWKEYLKKVLYLEAKYDSTL